MHHVKRANDIELLRKSLASDITCLEADPVPNAGGARIPFGLLHSRRVNVITDAT